MLPCAKTSLISKSYTSPDPYYLLLIYTVTQKCMLSLAVPWDKRKGRCRHNITTKLADGNRQEDDVQCSAGNKLHLIPQWTEEHGKETKIQSSTSKEGTGRIEIGLCYRFTVAWWRVPVPFRECL
jgi:hypothetical protein